MSSLRNQGFNQAQKDHADHKLLVWLPFESPGWNIADVAKESGLTVGRARRSLKRLLEQGLVIRERKATGLGNVDDAPVIIKGWEYRYRRSTRQREKRSTMARPR